MLNWWTAGGRSGACRLGRRVRLVTHVAYVVAGSEAGRFRVDRIETVPAAEFQRGHSLTGAWFTTWGQELVRHEKVEVVS